MQNVLDLRPDRPRPQRALGMPRNGARILFFTGVRYCRDPETPDAEPGCPHPAAPGSASGGRLDAAAH